MTTEEIRERSEKLLEFLAVVTDTTHMTSPTPTHRPINLADVAWIDNGRRAQFQARHPGFGVECIATGEVLSSDGVRPSVWDTKRIAAIIAADPPQWGTVPVTR